MFNRLFLGPLLPHREKIGPLMFEFSTFHQTDYGHGRDFMAELDRFLGELPRGEGWEFGVEIRNKTWLVPEYFAMLRSHGVAHVFNNWTKMPPVLEQLDVEAHSTRSASSGPLASSLQQAQGFRHAPFEPFDRLRAFRRLRFSAGSWPASTCISM